MKLVDSTLLDLPIPSSLLYWWNFGSLAGMSLMIQMITGLFLSVHYCSDISLAFSSIIYIMQDVFGGWSTRLVHANGASLFFLVLYIHVGRGLYYGAMSNYMTWMVGVSLLFLVMATSFLGYVLPWGQMSFWGATVITNLGSAVPYVGEDLVLWMWGGFSVAGATLTRFFSFHFLLPFLLSALVGIHLLYLHHETSSNPLGLSSISEKISFSPYFLSKDLFGMTLSLTLLLVLVLEAPFLLSDCENFIMSNPLVTPVHIQPEWYFLFAYAILRSIPNKLGGVLALVAAIGVLFILPYQQKSKFKSMTCYPMSQILFWGLVVNFSLLTWLGSCVVEGPFLLLSQVLSLSYFLFYILCNKTQLIWDLLF